VRSQGQTLTRICPPKTSPLAAATADLPEIQTIPERVWVCGYVQRDSLSGLPAWTPWHPSLCRAKRHGRQLMKILSRRLTWSRVHPACVSDTVCLSSVPAWDGFLSKRGCQQTGPPLRAALRLCRECCESPVLHCCKTTTIPPARIRMGCCLTPCWICCATLGTESPAATTEQSAGSPAISDSLPAAAQPDGAWPKPPGQWQLLPDL